MSRSLLLLTSSILRSFTFALVVIGTLIAANHVANAAAAPVLCGRPNDLLRTCPNNPACPPNESCVYVLFVPPVGPPSSSCICL
jgi:hypothetical protein